MSTAALPAGAAPVLDAGFVTGHFAAADPVLAADLATALAAGDRAGEAEAALFARALELRRSIGDRAGVAESLSGTGLRASWADGAASWLRRAEAGETPSFTRA